MNFFVRNCVKGGEKWSEELILLAQSELLNQQSIFLHHKAIEKEEEIVKNQEKDFSSRSTSLLKMGDYVASLHVKRNQRTKIREKMEERKFEDGLINKEALMFPNYIKKENTKDIKEARKRTIEDIEEDLEFFGGPAAKRVKFEPKYSRVVLTLRK